MSTNKVESGSMVCPDCGGTLREVDVKTVKHVLRYELARTLGEGRFLYCHHSECDVVYLRVSPEVSPSTPVGFPVTFEETFRRSDLKERVRPFAEGRDRLVCHCFGYTVGEIEDDARTGADLIPAAIAAEVRAGLCACEVMNPKGG